MSPAAQDDYNRIKGSISVRRASDASKMDSCSRDSARTFAHGAAMQAPSLVHRMATDDTTKDAIIMEVHDYFMNDQISAEDAQQRLAAIVRSLSRKNEGL
jgi:glucose/mannose transport system substrate-binding protein